MSLAQLPWSAPKKRRGLSFAPKCPTAHAALRDKSRSAVVQMNPGSLFSFFTCNPPPRGSARRGAVKVYVTTAMYTRRLARLSARSACKSCIYFAARAWSGALSPPAGVPPPLNPPLLAPPTIIESHWGGNPSPSRLHLPALCAGQRRSPLSSSRIGGDESKRRSPFGPSLWHRALRLEEHCAIFFMRAAL